MANLGGSLLTFSYYDVYSHLVRRKTFVEVQPIKTGRKVIFPTSNIVRL